MRQTTIKAWFAIHKWSSLVATAFLLMLCITGLPLIFHEEIEHWLEHHAEPAALPPGTPVPGIDALVAQAQTMAPGSTAQFIVFDREHPLVSIGLQTGDTPRDLQSHTFDLHSGELAPPAPAEGGFMAVMLRLHTDMYLGQAGLYFLGAMGLLLAVAIVSGAVLYSPFMRKLEFGTVRGGRTSRSRNRRLHWLDLHNLLGIITLAWALVVGLTGTINTWEQPIGRVWRATELTGMLAPHRDVEPPAQLASIDTVLATARQAAPGMQPVTLLFPGQELTTPGHFLAILSGTEALDARLFQTALIDGQTGALVEVRAMPWYVKALFLSQPLHFGDYCGLPLKILWTLLDLITIVVLASGLYLWFARRKATRKRLEHLLQAHRSAAASKPRLEVGG